jgi:hypothetical protein
MHSARVRGQCLTNRTILDPPWFSLDTPFKVVEITPISLNSTIQSECVFEHMGWLELTRPYLIPTTPFFEKIWP